MGFQGQLSSVNLTDIFQTLNMNHQTGTLSVTGADGRSQYVYFENGQLSICTAPHIDNRPFLINALLRKGFLTVEQADDLTNRMVNNSQPIRDLIVQSNWVQAQDLDETCAWCIEEIVCPIFESHQGEFTFNDGAPVQELTAPDVVAMGENKLQTTTLVLEATRREDEWKRIRQVIPDPDAIYVVDNDGRANLNQVENDPEVVKVLRFLDGRHSLENIANNVGVTKFDTFAIVAQLVLTNVARLRTPQELVEDANVLRSQGDLNTAYELLERTVKNANVPEVIRPLAEVCASLNQVPRAVELYLELIQQAQDQGQLEQALTDLDTVLGLSPDDPDLHFDRAQVLAELNRSEESAEAFVAAAQAYLATRDVSQAIDACHRAKNQVPRASDPHRYLAKAYLMDGQTDNAIVEYKSLWHALLSTERPRKALETLKQILDSDCKFAAIKDQVLNHAQNSDAVKTGTALRMLVYAALALLLIFGGVLGWEYFQNEVLKNTGQKKILELDSKALQLMSSNQHQDALDELKELGAGYSRFPDLVVQVEELRDRINKDYDDKAQAQLQIAQDHLNDGRTDQARNAIRELKKNFANSSAAKLKADRLLVQCNDHDKEVEVQKEFEGIQQMWKAPLEDWEQAIVKLDGLLARKELPATTRESLLETKVEWDGTIADDMQQYRRGERFKLNGQYDRAVDSWKKAMNARGEDRWKDLAREELCKLEREWAEGLRASIKTASERGDDQIVFGKLDELAKLAKTAFLAADIEKVRKDLELECFLTIDSRHAKLFIKQQGQKEVEVRAPADAKDGWTYRLVYHPDETKTVEVRRAGFTSKSIKISADLRPRTRQSVKLERGPTWESSLGGVPVTTPAISEHFILIGTDKATLEVVDTRSNGVTRAIQFTDQNALGAQALTQFGAPPFIFERRAYVILDDYIFAIDIVTQKVAWKWHDTSANMQLVPDSLYVQYHDLIPGAIQVFAGTTRNQLLVFGIKNDDKPVRYPSSDLEGELTGPPLVDHFNSDHSVLYAPVSSSLMAFDVTQASENSAMKPAFDSVHIDEHHEFVGRPVKVKVGNRPAILVVDSAATNGSVIAFDADPDVDNLKRRIRPWPLVGPAAQAPAYDENLGLAFVTVTTGKVQAINLASTNEKEELFWQYPQQGMLKGIPGAPVVGKRGVYFASATGTLYCVDIKTGDLKWSTDLPSPVQTGIVAVDGKIYVPTKNSKLLCYDEGEDD